MAGRATLVKSSVASIPILHHANHVWPPQKISRQLDQLSCQFLWGDTHQRRSCHTVSWVTITLPKAAGGLGIQSVRHRNRAILMNQAWRLYHSPHMLWAHVLKRNFSHIRVYLRVLVLLEGRILGKPCLMEFNGYAKV